MLRKLQRVLALVGCLLLAVSAGGWIAAKVGNRQAVAALEAVRLPPAVDGATEPDQSDWSESRIRGYRESLQRNPDAPLGILSIPDVDLEVAIHPGTDPWSLNRGVGWIRGTAGLAERGNVAIAGHRDGFFRALKDIEAGDTIQIVTPAGERSYVVEKTWIVAPEDVEVLEPTEASSITLVTCFPFYYVGPAPKRFIVRGLETESKHSSFVRNQEKTGG